MNNDNGANDTGNNGDRPNVGLLETERQELNPLRLEFEPERQRLLQECAQLQREIEQLWQAIEDDADALTVLLERARQPFQVWAMETQVLAWEQQQQQLLQQADLMEEDTDVVSPTIVEPNPQSTKLSQQQKIRMNVRGENWSVTSVKNSM